MSIKRSCIHVNSKAPDMHSQEKEQCRFCQKRIRTQGIDVSQEAVINTLQHVYAFIDRIESTCFLACDKCLKWV